MPIHYYIKIASVIVCISLLLSLFAPIKVEAASLWKYQCIDTMKDSRDKASSWMNDPKLSIYIQQEMTAIKNTGANCVAIDTPYDPQFHPYLLAWVKGARAANLHVWFRGSWSGWEGWFNYPKTLSTTNIPIDISTFIHNYPDLFENGDVFTPIPEAENGGPFNGSIDNSQIGAYRSLLITEYQTSQKSFADIHKQVISNWLSMSGGIAKMVMDKQTVKSLGNVVTIDHYVSNPQEMGEYIAYFHNQLGANVVIGEFGAPIPDINGNMTEGEQQAFVSQLLSQLYTYKDDLLGVNYWTLTNSSTALLNPDNTPRGVYQALVAYYHTTTIKGTVRDQLGNPITNLLVSDLGTNNQTYTNANGAYSISIPQEQATMQFDGQGIYKSMTASIKPNGQDVLTQDEILPLQNDDLGNWIRLILLSINRKIH